MTESQRIAEWQAIEAMRDAFRPQISRLVGQLFREQEERAVSGIKFSISEWLSFFGRQFWDNRMLDLLIGSVRKILEEGMLAGMLRAGLGELTQEQLDARNIQLDIVARQIARSELVNDATERDLTAMLTRMINENATQQEMQRAMREKFEGYQEYRVDRITNTVVVGAFEAGTLLSWQEAGIDKKGWLSTQDGRVRNSHDTRLHPHLAEPVELEAPFVLGSGATLMHPGDPGGKAGEIISCRCTMIPIFEGDEETAQIVQTIESV